MTPITAKRSGRSLPARIVLAIMVLASIGVLLALGTWQIERLQWKEALLARIEMQRASPPASLAEMRLIWADSGDIEYRPITVTGTFDHAREQFFFATHDGQPGFFVYTPLEVEGGEGWLFVNRGFVPYDDKGQATRAAGQIAGSVTITGLARSAPTQKPSWILPDNDPAKNIFYWKDLSAMAANAGIADPLPFFLDADATPNPGGLPIGGVTIVDLPNNHLQYAVTWYGLAAALSAICAVFLFRARRRDA